MSQMTSESPTTAAAASTPTPAATPATTTQPPDLHAVVQNTLRDVSEVLTSIQWAEEEIAAAQRRHPGHADLLWHSFSLLAGRFKQMGTEVVYRSHCRELLDRVIRGADTRPGTAAEVCCVMADTSLRAPLRSSAAGLYMRMWSAAGLPEIEQFTTMGAHHEALERTTINDHERFVRRSLEVPDRRLGDITCGGLHHAEPVTCRFAKPEQLTLT